MDMDDERMEAYVSMVLVGNLLESIYFRVFIMVLIILNSLLIGIQTDEKLVGLIRDSGAILECV